MKVHLQPQKDYWEKKGKLSDRVRPNCEAAPWVIEEIKKLEAMLKEPTKLMLIPEVMEQAGWRHCAEGQRTTQYCGMAEQARREERERCAKICDTYARDIDNTNNIASELAKHMRKK